MDDKLKKILEEIKQQPLRSSVITAGSLIDVMLEKVLRKLLLDTPKVDEMFKGSGSLSAFSAKISMAHALGLISKDLHDDIHLFRKIRNICAHELSLDDKLMNDIKSQVGNFKLLKHTAILGDNKDVQVHIGLEFTLIFFCLIKRLGNVQKIEEYKFEIHDNYLTFSDEENLYITDFTNKMKEK